MFVEITFTGVDGKMVVSQTRKSMGTKDSADENLLAKVIDTSSLVEYQDGSVISRTIVKKDVGTVTIFAFDEGEGLSEHTAPFDALVQIIDGEAEISINGKSLRATEGQLVIMPANKPHALKAIKRFKMVLIMIRS